MKKNSTPLIIQDLKDSYDWLSERGFIHDDIVIDQLLCPEVIIKNKKIISFCSNNYLGLSKHPKVLKAAENAVKKYGIGTCESRKLGGNLYLLEVLENKIAEFKHTEAAMIFATGLLTNVGVISAISDVSFYCQLFYKKKNSNGDSVILSDKLNHRSIQMGIKLAKAEAYKYDHCNMESLYELLQKHHGKRILIITDGVFSMDGDLTPLPDIIKLAKEFNAAVMVDDAHGTGVLGLTGRGTAEHFNVNEGIDIHMGTLSKAFGALGGFIAADKKVIDMLKINTSTYYFTSSLPAEQAAGLIEATKIVSNSSELRKKLWSNVYKIIKGIKKIGLVTPQWWSHIIPIMIGDEKKCIQAEDILLQEGILCSATTVPAVAKGEARLRITVNTTHKDEHINKLLNALQLVVKKLKLPVFSMKESDWQLFCKKIPGYIVQYLKETGDLTNQK